MRIEQATLLATIGSLIPGGLLALLGDASAKYGFMLLVIAFPFYCLWILCLVFLIHFVRRYLKLISMRSYVICAVLAGLLPLLAVTPNDGWWCEVNFGISVTIAVLLVPFIQGQQDRTAG